MQVPLEILPAHLVQRASLRGSEYAWLVSDIPDLIEAVRRANLVNVGGCLQFRPPGATCELYYIAVNTHGAVPPQLPWTDRVRLSADDALDQFQALCAEEDFITEGKLGFARQLEAYEANGGDLRDITYFVWYAKAEDA